MLSGRARKAFWIICKFLPANIFGTFLFDSLSLIIINMLEIYSFKPLRYICDCNNFSFGFFSFWRILNLGVYGYFNMKKALASVFLRQIKHNAHAHFSVCSFAKHKIILPWPKIVFKPRFWEMSLVVFYVHKNSFCLLLLIMSYEKIKKERFT